MPENNADRSEITSHYLNGIKRSNTCGHNTFFVRIGMRQPSEPKERDQEEDRKAEKQFEMPSPRFRFNWFFLFHVGLLAVRMILRIGEGV
ncbi:MAG TPA: hypothetical protein VJ952_04200 [Opitutales bacterium]|nr:hypothetical protein [Opitutales bacterium]